MASKPKKGGINSSAQNNNINSKDLEPVASVEMISSRLVASPKSIKKAISNAVRVSDMIFV